MTPLGLNHVAYVTWDTAATVAFYTGLLGMKLSGHALDTAEDGCRFLHTFFEMADGSSLAFFEIDGVPREDATTPVPDWARHIALNVSSVEELSQWELRLREAGVEVIAVKDHEGVWKSMYFYDPNGIRLELTHQHRPLGAADAAAAAGAVDLWLRRSPIAMAGTDHREAKPAT